MDCIRNSAVLRGWRAMTPLLLTLSAFILGDWWRWLNLLAVLAIPVVVWALPGAKGRECLWGMLLTSISFIPTNIWLVQQYQATYIYQSNLIKVVEAVAGVIVLLNFEVLALTLLLRVVFPNQVKADF